MHTLVTHIIHMTINDLNFQLLTNKNYLINQYIIKIFKNKYVPIILKIFISSISY